MNFEFVLEGGDERIKKLESEKWACPETGPENGPKNSSQFEIYTHKSFGYEISKPQKNSKTV